MTNREVLQAIANGTVNPKDYRDLPALDIKAATNEISNVMASDDRPRPAFYNKSYIDENGKEYSPEEVMVLIENYLPGQCVQVVHYIVDQDINAVSGIICHSQTVLQALQHKLKAV